MMKSSDTIKISIVIVTRNRSESLRATLESLRHVEIPLALEVELLVIDNGSSDSTEEVVHRFILDGLAVRYIYEDKSGLSNGRNRALKDSVGSIVLFSDDDVRFPRNWIQEMCSPIILDQAEVVVGGICLAPELLRPWMTHKHRSFLASSERLDHKIPQSMVGANMAFSKKVLAWVPKFDPELGAGALGSGEESLFFSQLKRAGAKVCGRLDVSVEHHFDLSRLTRDSLLDSAVKIGESDAYRGHHWEHWGYRWGRLRLLVCWAKLIAWRLVHRPEKSIEGCTEMELELVYHHSLVSGHVREHKMSRKYLKHGSVKINPED